MTGTLKPLNKSVKTFANVQACHDASLVGGGGMDNKFT